MVSTSVRKRVSVISIIAIQGFLLLWCAQHGYLNFLKPEHKYTSGIMTITQWESIVNSDPKIGSVIPIAKLVDESGGEISTHETDGPLALLFVSSCATCIAEKVTLWDGVQHRHPGVECLVVPMDEDLQKVKRFQQAHHVQTKIIVSGKSEVTNACNPYFKPRVYLFDKSHQLVYIQSGGVSTNVAIGDIDTLLNGGKSKAEVAERTQ